MTDYTELKRLVDRVLTDRRFCGDENHKALADGVRALIDESGRLSAACTRAEQVINAESKAAAIATGRANLLQSEHDQLKAENEALRKDAERYRWLRDGSESIHQFYLSTPIWFTGVKFSKENVDSTIDAALGKGEQS